MLASSDTPAAAERVRALVVYHHRIVGTMLDKLLGRSHADVLGPFRPEEVSATLFEQLRPDVVVIDQEAWADLDGSQAAALMSSTGTPLSLILVDLSNDALSLWRRETIEKPSATALIRMVLGGSAAARAPQSSG